MWLMASLAHGAYLMGGMGRVRKVGKKRCRWLRLCITEQRVATAVRTYNQLDSSVGASLAFTEGGTCEASFLTARTCTLP